MDLEFLDWCVLHCAFVSFASTERPGVLSLGRFALVFWLERGPQRESDGLLIVFQSVFAHQVRKWSDENGWSSICLSKRICNCSDFKNYCLFRFHLDLSALKWYLSTDSGKCLLLGPKTFLIKNFEYSTPLVTWPGISGSHGNRKLQGDFWACLSFENGQVVRYLHDDFDDDQAIKFEGDYSSNWAFLSTSLCKLKFRVILYIYVFKIGLKLLTILKVLNWVWNALGVTTAFTQSRPTVSHPVTL